MRTTRIHPSAAILACACIMAWPAPAMAGIAGIGNAVVDKGALNIHLRTSYTADGENPAIDQRFRSRLMVDYGFTDRLAMGIYLQGDNRRHDNQELDAIILETRVELHSLRDHPFYSGFRLRYTYKDGDKKPDNAHIRLIFGVPVNRWEFRINQILAHEAGEGARGGLGIDTRLQASYGYHPNHRIGIESFSDFGYGSRQPNFDAQNHAIGPVFTGFISENLTYEAGYRYGISDAAANHTVKLFLTRRF